MTNNPKQLPNCMKKSETSIVLIIFNCGLYHVYTYTVTVSYRCSTRFRYKEKLYKVHD